MEAATRKVALITGGSRGIGLGIAHALARDGFDLLIAGQRPEEAVREALLPLGGLGARVLYQRADIGSPADREALVAAARKHFGALNVLVNNAGMAPRVRADLLDASEESFDELVRVNLKGPYFLTQLCARWMVEQRRGADGFTGCIINVGSVSAEVASTNRGDYCLTKAALGMATKLWAARLGEFDIPVYEIRPGIIRTDMTAGVSGKYDGLIAQGLLVQPRWGLPEDVGRAAAALARGDIPYATGQVLNVDGGLTLPRL